ncbi:MAG: lipoate--protein ligase [Planctomycetes bacterium]|nr:lipoate--protein ligase [Planctomycetota bacterium]
MWSCSSPPRLRMTFPGRMLIDRVPADGAWNMAVDEVLLESALARGLATIRWYRWRSATVSLGYFQQLQHVAGDPRLAGLPAVRRLSGGGAILHHHELTYSCALPAEHACAVRPLELYDRVHSAIVAVLRAAGIPAALRGRSQRSGNEPFLCFGRPDPRDVILHGHKVLGSAQRRRRGAVLQHGSLLLARSQHAPAFPGVNDLAPAAGIDADLAPRLAESLERELELSGEHGTLDSRERARIEDLEQRIYRHPELRPGRCGEVERQPRSA